MTFKAICLALMLSLTMAAPATATPFEWKFSGTSLVDGVIDNAGLYGSLGLAISNSSVITHSISFDIEGLLLDTPDDKIAYAKQGYVIVTVTDKFGNQTSNYESKILANDYGLQLRLSRNVYSYVSGRSFYNDQIAFSTNGAHTVDGKFNLSMHSILRAASQTFTDINFEDHYAFPSGGTIGATSYFCRTYGAGCTYLQLVNGSGSIGFFATPVLIPETPVPEPTSLALALLALAAVVHFARRAPGKRV